MDDTLSTSLSPAAATRHPKLRLPATCDPPSESNPVGPAVWIVFGATGHMGRSLVRAILSHGDKVTAVGFTQENTLAQMAQMHPHDPNYLGLLCDVRVRETVAAVFARSAAHWGRRDDDDVDVDDDDDPAIDVIANCTTYGILAPCEDQTPAELAAQFETNVQGTLNILQLSLPLFRARGRRGGRYLIFSSTTGTLGVPGLGPYCATKYAVEALVESMLYEVDAFNIKATLVEPGHVRQDEPAPTTSGAGPATDPSSTHLGLRRFSAFWLKTRLSAPYRAPTAPAAHARRIFQWLDDRQPTSAVRCAELLWQLGRCRFPPLRLLLGSFAVECIRDRMRCVIEEIEDWKFLCFPGGGEEGRGEEEGEEIGRMEGEGQGEEGGEERMEEEGEGEGE